MAEPNAPDQRFLAAPYFVVPEITAAAEHYRDKLGFTFNGYWGDPPSFVMVQRAGVTIMLKAVAGVEPAPNHRQFAGHEGVGWDAYIWVPDATSLYDELGERGADIARPLEDAPYGCREFEVRDNNGYVICFGQDLEA